MEAEEKERVLFSPIGKTDPTRGGYDGPFLHILRWKQPSKAYLFMTAEICEYDSLDDRYQKLAKRVCPSCQIEKIKKKKLTDPSNFDIFYSQYEEILTSIHLKNPDADILVNVSSGTPQMISTLNLLCTVSKLPLTPVQVKSPEHAGNMSKSVSSDYDIEKEWDSDKDNCTDGSAANRCKEITSQNNELALIARVSAKNMIERYQYDDAEQLLRLLIRGPYTDTDNLLLAADNRLKLNSDQASLYAKRANYELFPIPQADTDAHNVFEYILYLQIKSKRSEITEFARGISPVLTTLFASYLKEKCDMDVLLYCAEKHDGILYLTEQKLADAKLIYLFEKKHDFNDTPLTFSSMQPLIEKGCSKCGLSGDLLEIKKLREFEEKIRNVAAHQMTYIENSTLLRESGLDSGEVLEKLKYFFKETYPKYAAATDWNSYETMNSDIVALLGV